MTFEAYFLDVASGQKGRKLNPTGSASWAVTLNGNESLDSFTVPKSDLALVERRWWQRWRGGVLLTFEGEPLVAGPVVAPPTENRDSLTFKVGGVGSILERRLVVNPEYSKNPEYPTAADMKALAESELVFEGMSLGTIADEVVRVAVNKLGGTFPVRYASPRETGSGLNRRTYHGYNVANLGAWKLLQELANVRNGPDFLFRPEWADESQNYVRWAFYRGTRSQPAISQDSRVVIDTTSPKGPAFDPQFTVEASHQTNRVYWSGAGEDEGTLLRVVQDVSRLAAGELLLESTGSTSDSDEPDLVEDHARAALAAGRVPVTQLTTKVDAKELATKMGQGGWRVGDACDVVVKGWYTVPDGKRPWRVVAAKGSTNSDLVTLELQEDAEWFSDET